MASMNLRVMTVSVRRRGQKGEEDKGKIYNQPGSRALALTSMSPAEAHPSLETGPGSSQALLYCFVCFCFPIDRGQCRRVCDRMILCDSFPRHPRSDDGGVDDADGAMVAALSILAEIPSSARPSLFLSLSLSLSLSLHKLI